MPDRECVICKTPFTPRRGPDKTCSLDCQVRLRRQRSRESMARRYQPRALRPDTECDACKARIPVPKTGPAPRWCQSCRARKEDDRARKRVAVRRCFKCQEPLAETDRRPGARVCDNCRVDPRKRSQDHEHRRRLRRYGLTQDEYDRLLVDQGGRCAACNAGPGTKGWCIDHCHRSGRVRALLCSRCNTAIGLADEDPAVLRSMADWLEQQTAQVG